MARHLSLSTLICKRMKRYLLLFIGLAFILLILFGLGTWLLPATWHDPTNWMAGGRVFGTFAGLLLLITDVVLPVPSTLIMTGLGVIHGVAIGTLLSLIGNMGAAVFGFWIGRKSRSSLNRFLSEDEHDAAALFLARWGEVGLILSRPIPVLAESVVILAGTSGAISWPMLLRSTAIGALPASLLYAWVGSTARTLESGIFVFAGVLLLAGLTWFISVRVKQHQSIPHEAL